LTKLLQVDTAGDTPDTARRDFKIFNHMPGDDFAGDNHQFRPPHHLAEQTVFIKPVTCGDKRCFSVTAGKIGDPGRDAGTGVDNIDVFIQDNFTQGPRAPEESPQRLLMDRQAVMAGA
jgi:hypothetical protein